jgi:uncharacterized protein DUF5658
MFTRKRTLQIMLAAFVLIEVADLATTNAIIQRGGTEANPLMAWAMTSFGGAWVIPKLALVAIALCLLPRFKRLWHVAVAVGASAIPVASNLVVLAAGL